MENAAGDLAEGLLPSADSPEKTPREDRRSLIFSLLTMVVSIPALIGA